MPVCLHDGIGAAALDDSSKFGVRVGCHDGIDVIAVKGIERILSGVVKDGLAVQIVGRDVCGQHVHVGLCHFAVSWQVFERVEDGIVACVEFQSCHFPCAGLVRGVGGDESGDGHLYGITVTDGNRHHRPGLAGVGDTALMAHVGTDVAEVPAPWQVV